MKTRQAIMMVSTHLLLDILPAGKTIDCVADKLGAAVDYVWLHAALLLPADCRITGVSMSLGFDRDQIAIRVESHDFPETEEGCHLPEVRAWYERRDGKPTFVGWVLPDAGRERIAYTFATACHRELAMHLGVDPDRFTTAELEFLFNDQQRQRQEVAALPFPATPFEVFLDDEKLEVTATAKQALATTESTSAQPPTTEPESWRDRQPLL